MFENSFMSSLDDVPHEREVTIIGDFVFVLVADTTTAFNVFEHLHPVNRGKNLVIRFNDFHIKAPFFLVAYRKAETVRTHPNQAAWVYRTVFLTFLNYHHKESRQKAGVPLESYEDIADDLVIDEIVACRDMLCRAVDKLPEKDYELYQDVYTRGLSPAQIAAKEGKRTDTITRRISRLNQKLRENINKLSENGVIRHNISEGSSQS